MVSNQMLLCRDCGRRFNPPDRPAGAKGVGKTGREKDAPPIEQTCRYCGSSLVLVDERG